MMKKAPALNWLVPLTGILALVAAGAGLFWQDGGSPYFFTTLHGQTVEMYGQGVYRNDSLFTAAGFKGVDAVTLFAALPLLAISFLLYRRGSLRGGLLLASTLSYFVYIGATMTFAAAFNSLFLVYTALFSASLFAFIAALDMIDVQALAGRISPRLPARGLAVFMLAAGLGTFGLWMSELIGPLMTGQPPENLGPYTTLFTHGFDSAVITPATVLTAILLLRRRPLGCLLAAPMLILSTLIGLTVIAATISQTLAGVTFPIGVYIGMVGSWTLMGAVALWLGVAFFRSLPESLSPGPASARAEYA